MVPQLSRASTQGFSFTAAASTSALTGRGKTASSHKDEPNQGKKAKQANTGAK